MVHIHLDTIQGLIETFKWKLQKNIECSINISWTSYTTNKDLYDNTPKLSISIKTTRDFVPVATAREPDQR